MVSFFFNATPTTDIYTLSLHDALPISARSSAAKTRSFSSFSPAAQNPTVSRRPSCRAICRAYRSEEHTSELQSLTNLVCRLLLEKKNKHTRHTRSDSQTRAQDTCARLA